MTVDEQIYRHLQEMHQERHGWLFIGEMRTGTGYGQFSEQSIDAWAIQAWGKRVGHIAIKNLMRAFEIKVSRSDAVRELRNPDKRWYAYAVSHEFYFVAPAGLFLVGELAEDDGLIELFHDGGLRVTKKAKIRSPMPPRWSFVASLVRRQVEIIDRLKAKAGENCHE